MKRIVGLLLAILLLAGCAGQNGNVGQAGGAEAGPGEASSAPDAARVYFIRYELGDLQDEFTLTPEGAKCGDLVEIRTRVLHDADLHVYLDDGRELPKSHYDSDYWGYSFTMPDRDVTLTAKPFTKSELLGPAGDGSGIVTGVQYVRTNGYVDGAAYPKIFWISSAAELQAYREANRETYGLDGGSFAAAVQRYDDSFFETGELIVVLLEEGSGSNRHEVTGVKVSPSEQDGKKYELRPEIKRIVPECGTCDMAEWHILIEIAKDHGASVSALKEPLLTTVVLAG